MIKQISLLCKVQLCNLFRWNEVRYTKDKSKKRKFVGMACVWAFLLVMVIGYVAGFAYGMAWLGAEEIVPMYLYTIVSLLILMFTFFKAGGTIFSMKTYEMLVSLPIKRAAVVASRFLCMYVSNLLLSLIVVVPGNVVYCIYAKPDGWFYVVTLISTLFLPLLPLTLASIAGAVITGLTARMKHKSMGEAILMLAAVVVIMVGSFSLSGTENLNLEQLQEMVGVLTETIGSVYPPALWYRYALDGEGLYFLLLLAVPVVCFFLFVVICGYFFQPICTLLNAVHAKNNYKMEKLRANSAFAAFTKKEMRRYFSSGIYVSNTLVGYVLAILLSGALFFGGTDMIVKELEAVGIRIEINQILPFILPLLFSLANMSSCSISMEGKCFWNVQVLPVSNKVIYDSKIATNMIIAMPFYVVSAFFLSFSGEMSWIERMWIFVIPLCYVVFLAVVGITVNLKFPVMKWENEVSVVKQSVSVLLSMLIGCLSAGIPLACTIVLGTQYKNGIAGGCVLAIMTVTSVLYRYNNTQSVSVEG